MPFKLRIQNFSRQFLFAVVGYELLVIGGIAFFMVGAMLIGYLPYTDRPGPGWYGPSATLQQIPMVGEWLKLRAWVPPIYGAVIFLLMKALSLIPRLPRAVVRVVASLLAGAIAVIWVAATGWYFALALSVQWAALALAVVYGSWFLPKVLYVPAKHTA
jgi:hypothetical protein